jgi:basic membrane protein A
MKKAAGVGAIALAAALSVAAIGCKKAPEAGRAAAKRPSIGIAFDMGDREDGSFNDLSISGLRQVAEAYGGYIEGEPGGTRFGDKVELRYLESRLQGQDREQLVRVLAEEGCDLVFGMGLPFADVMRKAARDFPETSFALIDAAVPDQGDYPNLVCVGFAEQEGSFLAGALAGMIVRDRPKAKVGFIGGMDSPLTHKYDAGFRAGAAFVDPALRKNGMILRQYCGKDKTALSDPATAKAIAASQYKAGAEVIYHAAGGSGAGLFEAAREAGKLAIGADSDQGLAYSSDAKNLVRAATGERIASSMLKRVDRAIFVLSTELIGTGRVRGGYRLFNLANDGVACAVNAYNKERLAPYEDALGALKARIISGEIRVPADDPSCEAFIAGLK